MLALSWKECFGTYSIIDFPVLGNYIKYIPCGLLADYKIVKIDVDKKDRERNRKSRKMTVEHMKKLDDLYIEPPFFDKHIYGYSE